MYEYWGTNTTLGPLYWVLMFPARIHNIPTYEHWTMYNTYIYKVGITKGINFLNEPIWSTAFIVEYYCNICKVFDPEHFSPTIPDFMCRERLENRQYQGSNFYELQGYIK